jgi:cytochrome c
MLCAGAASAQSGEKLLDAKGCLACHDQNAKKVGPSFQDIAAKYKADKRAQAKLTAALKEGKGHPVKVDASDAELKALVQQVLKPAAPGAKAAAKPEAAADARPEAKAAAEKPDSETCLACHGNAGFSAPGPNGKERPLHVESEKFLNSVHG